MPTYLYLCEKHGEFEEMHSMSQTLEFCPHCEKEGLSQQEVKKLINCLSRGVVELYGSDLVDKIKSDANQLKKDAAKSEKIYANLLGEGRHEQLQRRIDKQKR